MIMNRNQLADVLVKSNVDTTELHVANMRGNYSKSKLIKKLSNLNYATNYRLNRYSLKKNSKFPRVAFYCFNEYAFNNTHSHIYIQAPPCYVYENVVTIMKEEWLKLDDSPNKSYEFYSDKVDKEKAYAMYSVKEFNARDEESFIVL